MRNQQLPDILSTIGGLDFPIVTVPKRLLDLPGFVPQLPNPWFASEPALDYHTVAIGVNKVFGVHGQIKEELLRAESIQKWMNVSPSTQVLLIGCAKDRTLENIWEQLDAGAAFEQLARLGVAGMTALNFSIYHNEPRMEHLVNLKRSALTALEATRYGMCAIPHIHWGGQRDLERLAQWIQDCPTVEIVAFSMQTYKSRSLWRRALAGIRYFQSLVGRPITYLLIGVASQHRVDELLPHIPRVSLVSVRPAMLAVNYRLMDDGGGANCVPSANRADLFARNLEVILSRINGRLSASA